MPEPSPPTPPASKGGLGQKVGPLPAWAWAGFLVGGVALILLFRGAGNKSGSDTTSEDQQSLETTSAKDAAELAALAALFTGGGSPGSNGSPSISPDPGIGVCPIGYENQNGICLPIENGGGGHARGPLPPTPLPPPAMGARQSTYWSPRVG